jgi:hypothetical protein
MKSMIQKKFAGCAVLSLWLTAVLSVSVVWGEDSPKRRDDLDEPLLRVAKATVPRARVHPLDPALDMARDGLRKMQTSVRDYTCTIVKRERIKGELMDYEYMYAKIRNRRVVDGQTVSPFSVYMYFLKPAEVKGREVLYVEGENEGKLIAHEGGSAGKYLPTVWLKPTGLLAMRNQRYPITDIGIENLVAKLIERGETDQAKARTGCEVTFTPNAKINTRVCTVLQIKHAKPAPDLDFHYAQIFIDDELQVPIRYAAYGFPEKEGERPPVLEEYTYLNLKLNVGLQDRDFDHENTDYRFQ